jgi:shikimate kinase
VVLDPDHRRVLRDRCRVVWLEVSPDEAMRRIGTGAGRPLLAGGSLQARLKELLDARAPHYESVAHVRVKTDGRDPQQVADEVLAASPGEGT